MNADHTPHEHRLTVNRAAELLGISAEAVRARINRGTLQKEKDEDGTVYVRMDADQMRTDGADTNDHTLPESKAFQLMQEQVDYLRHQLEVWQDEARRKDHIIAALTERIPELEAPESATRASDTAKPRSATEEQQAATSRPWWRRLFGS